MSRRLYVGRLPYDCRARDLERLFDEFGDIRDIDLHSGYAFVEYYHTRDADDALYYLDNTRFMGERIIVEPSRERRLSPPRRSDYRIVVENVAPSVNWQDLKSYFKRCGEITYADVDTYREEGIVEFAHYDDFKYALDEYHGRTLDGRRIRVYDDRPRARSRSRTPADRRSRSRSRSRSASRGRRDRSPTPAKRERRESSVAEKESRNDSGNEGSPSYSTNNNNDSSSEKKRMEDEGVQDSRREVAAH